ncbi:hypothetical protein B0H34DRAFT_856063 [Crassisporium funariophilum]|nr:hypothetical protein B0H34DRAFT_856063 [Crassisporium funariophilum]
MRTQFPEFRYCEDNWKIHEFGKVQYPDFKKDLRKNGKLSCAQLLINARPHPTSTEATSSSTKRKSDNMASSSSICKHQKKKVKTTMHIAATNIINLNEDSDNSGLEYVHEIQPRPLGPAYKPPLNTTTNKPVHPVRQSLDLMPTAMDCLYKGIEEAQGWTEIPRLDRPKILD